MEVIVVDDNKERLQKVLASSGVASRRKCEEIIQEGRVAVNGEVVTVLGTKVSKKDIITVDGKLIQKEELVYYVLNKPTGYLTTVSDPKNRRTVMDLIEPEDKKKRIFPIGRLDYDTSGVLLFTNDGNLSYRLTRSNKEIEKTYHARLDGIIDQTAVTKLIRGVMIDGVMTKRASIEILDIDKKNNSTLIALTITEGRNRQVRKMCETVGFPVKKLKRVAFGTITLEGLTVGAYRPLKPHEIKKLYSL